jgi:urea transport system permease protein
VFPSLTKLRLLAAVLVLPLLLWRAEALALDPAVVAQLGAGDVATRVLGIEALTRSADPAGLPLLEAMRDGNLAVTPSGQVLIVEGESVKDAATFAAIEPAPTEYESVTINNRVRGQIEAALSAFQLFSESRDQRLQAAKALESSAQASTSRVRIPPCGSRR